MCAQSLSRVQLSATPLTTACQAPLSMEFPRQEYWSGLPFPSPGDLPDPGLESVSYIGRWTLYHCTTREALSTTGKHKRGKTMPRALCTHPMNPNRPVR